MLSQQEDLPYTDNVRLMSIATQVKELLIRSRYVRNSILWMQSAIGLFVVTSAGIGINLFITGEVLQAFPMMLFICGMIAVVVGIVFAGMEVHRSYRIVLLEAQAED
jgi:hypothetical protein